ncbi:TetR family transcriptional regulator [Paracoccus limosus]|jgi:AcrR family transcriptional regulator|uniref:TetR family transcriptional regulator n=1 Tax=Paracoccus limosus TaxID=913252 RepID=A0A844H409_9RHOB|nr:TetR/AcrR family transcriptional regulator [Paracoccus limosus]MTH35689.1 TetR family transcriptional regulator [Paracoccus limosus]
MTKTLPVIRGRKFLQVIEGARAIFMRDGFEGATVDDIARQAGVSKATLYSYFPDKRVMFKEVFRADLSREVADAGALLQVDMPVDQILPFVVSIISAQLVSEFGVQMYRVSVGEAERFPGLAREYYESGPLLMRQQLVTYLQRCVGRGELRIDDMELAADQLISLASATVRNQALFIGVNSIDKERLLAVCAGAVRMFLACYGAEKSTCCCCTEH